MLIDPDPTDRPPEKVIIEATAIIWDLYSEVLTVEEAATKRGDLQRCFDEINSFLDTHLTTR